MNAEFHISQLEIKLRKEYGPGYEGSTWQLLVNAMRALQEATETVES